MSQQASPSFLHALRRDPPHAAELAVLYALAQIGPHVANDPESGLPGERTAERAMRVVRRAVKRARVDGAVMGTSLYVALPAAVISVYYRQVAMVLRIAALHGHDPADPCRAAEALVIAGHHSTLAAAAKALAEAQNPAPKSHRARLRSALRPALHQLAGIIGVNLKGWRTQPAIDKVLALLQMASTLVPFVGIPSNAAGTARATKQMGHTAIAFYAADQTGSTAAVTYTLPPPPGRRERLRLLAVASSVCVLAFVLPLLITGSLRALLGHWALIALGELFLVTTFTRLLWITRPSRPRAGYPGSTAARDPAPPRAPSL